MLTRRRVVRAGLLAGGLAAAAAAVWAVGTAAPGPASAGHGAAPPGHVWVSGAAEATTTRMWLHVNAWDCANRGCPPGVTTKRTYCELRAASAARVPSNGCGHTLDGWRWTGHGPGVTIEGSYYAHGADMGGVRHFCADGMEAEDASHCGAWTACSGSLVPNASKTQCVPCPAGQRPDGSNNACETPPPPTTAEPPPPPPPTSEDPPDDDDDDPPPTTTQPEAPGPPAPVTAPPAPTTTAHPEGLVCQAWTGTECITWTEPPTSGVCAETDGARKVWDYEKALWESGRPRLSTKQRGNPPADYRAVDFDGPAPVHAHWARPWKPNVTPSGPVVATAGEPSAIRSWAGGDFTDGGPDGGRPLGWGRSGAGIFRRVPGGVGGAQCAVVNVTRAASGWLFTNLELETGPSSGSGRRSGAFTPARKTDWSRPAGFTAWDTWHLTVELSGDIGYTRYPACPWLQLFPGWGRDGARIKLTVPNPSAAWVAARRRARDDHPDAWRWIEPFTPAGRYSYKSCGWAITVTRSAVIALTRHQVFPGV